MTERETLNAAIKHAVSSLIFHVDSTSSIEASENSGKIHGKIGAIAAKAINLYIDQEEKHIGDLAKKALKLL